MKSNLNDFKQPKEKLEGIYRGVVENNKDPQGAGRCKIRIFGIHSDNLNDISTDSLPWAQPVLSLIEGSVSGYGLFGVPLQGSHVFVFFEGGNILQPRYFGSAPAKPTTAPDKSKGFNDPDGVYPNKIGSYDWNTASGTYPHNVVLSVHGGHYIEFDSTSGNERINVYHKSGTTILIDKNGNINITGVRDKTEILGGNLSVTASGNISIEATGNVIIKGARVDINP